MQTTIVLCLFIAACSAAVPRPAVPSTNILGGNEATPGQFPYMVYIKNNTDYFVCGGVIINSRWILTTGFCVYGYSEPQLQVVAGTTDLESGGEIYKVEQLVPHPDYVPGPKKFNIGLIEVQKTIGFSNLVQAIPLGGAPTPNEKFITMGWGSNVPTTYYSSKLRFMDDADYSIITREDCQTVWGILQATQICLRSAVGKGICDAKDAGAPLVADGQVVAMYSHSLTCAAGYPDVFEQISSFKEWINSRAIVPSN